MRIARRFNAGKIGMAISPEGTAERRPRASESSTPPRVPHDPKNALGHRSIAQISLVVFNSVFLEQSQELLLKSNLTMMLLLVSNVSNDSVLRQKRRNHRPAFFGAENSVEIRAHLTGLRGLDVSP